MARGCAMEVNAASAAAKAIACSSMAIRSRCSRSAGNASVRCSANSIPSAEPRRAPFARNTAGHPLTHDLSVLLVFRFYARSLLCRGDELPCAVLRRRGERESEWRGPNGIQIHCTSSAIKSPRDHQLMILWLGGLRALNYFCRTGTLFTCRTLINMSYTQRLLDRIPRPTFRLFVCLSIISAIGIMGLALVAHSGN
jgi:hypothetical protein